MDNLDQINGLTEFPEVPGFHIEGAVEAADRCWFRGRTVKGGTVVLLRGVDGITLGEAVQYLTECAGIFDNDANGIRAPVAVIVTSGNVVVAGASAPESAITVDIDQAKAGLLADDSRVLMWFVYAEPGDELLVDVAKSPVDAVRSLASVAEVLDSVGGGHGSLDSACLRVNGQEAQVLGFGISPLESIRRMRIPNPAAWNTIAPERCLPPGHATLATDQYALAVLWTIARTGRAPHSAATVDELLRLKFSEPPRVEGLTAKEEKVILRGLSSLAESRFNSLSAFVNEIAIAISEDQGLALREHDGPISDHDSEMSAAAAMSEETAKPDKPQMKTSLSAENVIPSGTETAQVDTARTGIDDTAELPKQIDPSTPTVPGLSLKTELPRVPAQTNGGVAPNNGGSKIPGLATAPYRRGDEILPGYRLDRLLGKGGFGEVWKATAPGGMNVAIKIISSLGRRQGVREFRALKTVKDIHHAHIVPVFGVWLKEESGRLLDENEAAKAGELILQSSPTASPPATNTGVTAESLELIVAMGLGDETLYDRLSSRRGGDHEGGTSSPIELGQLLTWMRQAAVAIDYFNRGGRVLEGKTTDAVQHCDIKPHNILLVGDEVQICDFGLARAQGQARVTANNLLSIAYAAPEMMAKPYEPSTTTDQYSLAVTYHELRTGRLPFGSPATPLSEDVSVVELMQAKLKGELDLSRVYPAEQLVLQTALAVAPAARFGSCVEFVDRLQAAIGAASHKSVAARKKPFPVLQFAGLSLTAVASVALLLWVLLPPPTPPLLPQAQRLLQGAVIDGDTIDTNSLEKARKLAEDAAAAGEDASDCKTLIRSVSEVVKIWKLIDGAAAAATSEIAVENERQLNEADSLVKNIQDKDGIPEEIVVALFNQISRQKESFQAARKVDRRASLESAVVRILGQKQKMDENDVSQSMKDDFKSTIQRLEDEYPDFKLEAILSQEEQASSGSMKKAMLDLMFLLYKDSYDARRWDESAQWLNRIWNLLDGEQEAWEKEKVIVARSQFAWLLACGKGGRFMGDPVLVASKVLSDAERDRQKVKQTGGDSIREDAWAIHCKVVLALAYSRAGDYDEAGRLLEEVMIESSELENSYIADSLSFEANKYLVSFRQACVDWSAAFASVTKIIEYLQLIRQEKTWANKYLVSFRQACVDWSAAFASVTKIIEVLQLIRQEKTWANKYLQLIRQEKTWDQPELEGSG